MTVGSSAGNGERFLAESGRHRDRALFVQPDLATVAGTRGAAEQIAADDRRIDALVLGANRLGTKRVVTEDGFESTFALYYLSRRILVDELREQLGPGDAGGSGKPLSCPVRAGKWLS